MCGMEIVAVLVALLALYVVIRVGVAHGVKDATKPRPSKVDPDAPWFKQPRNAESRPHPEG